MQTKFIPASLLRVLMMVSALVAPAALGQDSARDDSHVEVPVAEQEAALEAGTDVAQDDGQDTAQAEAEDAVEAVMADSAQAEAQDTVEAVMADSAQAEAQDAVEAVVAESAQEEADPDLAPDSAEGNATDSAQGDTPEKAADIAAEYTTNHARDLPAAYVTSSHQILAYNRTIREIESREGAYGENLSESLLGLALILQSQGRHDEAIKLFKRGAHLTRVNEGLYCAQQLPFVRGEIASQKAQQNYAQADQRHNYLHHVLTKSTGSGDALADAYMEQAQWQYDAYQLRLEPKNYTRLINMWELYRMAFTDIVSREGKTSPKLLPPLRGMLQAQYLISSYEILPSTPVFGEEGQIDEDLLRFKTYHNQSYQQGNAIIAAIAGIERERSPPDSPNHARALVMLGDWRLWNGKNTAALEAYRAAETELARTKDAQAQAQQLFGEPVALPDIADMSLLPPEVEPNESAVTLAFGVTEYGRVQDVERLDDNEEDDTQAFRLMRQLRKITFRPRFVSGQPVETEKLVKAFQIQ